MRPKHFALAALVWLSPTPTLAQDALDARAMNAQMREYFEGERQQGYVFLGHGLTSLGVGAFLVTRDDPLARGAGYPALAFGALQAFVGASVALRAGGQIDDRRARIANDPEGFARDERARMDGVMSRFTVAQAAEVTLIGAGLGLFAYGALRDRPALEGVGLAVAAEAALTLGLEYLATERGRRYARDLDVFDPSAGRGAVGLTWRGRF